MVTLVFLGVRMCLGEETWVLRFDGIWSG